MKAPGNNSNIGLVIPLRKVKVCSIKQALIFTSANGRKEKVSIFKRIEFYKVSQ
jgi:hypothetical protein